jgi:hypothetical protein
MAHNTLRQMKVASVNSTTVVLNDDRFVPEPQYPISSLTIVYPSGQVPSDFVTGANVRVSIRV